MIGGAVSKFGSYDVRKRNASPGPDRPTGRNRDRIGRGEASQECKQVAHLAVRSQHPRHERFRLTRHFGDLIPDEEMECSSRVLYLQIEAAIVFREALQRPAV